MKIIPKKAILASGLCLAIVAGSASPVLARGAYSFIEAGVYQEVYANQKKCVRESKNVYKTCVRLGTLCNRTYYATRQTLRRAKARLKRGNKLKLIKFRQGITVCTIRPK